MVTPDKIKLSAPTFAATDGISHGFFTRQGGVSGGIYASLNCGPGSRDEPENVKENRARVAELLGTEPGRLLSVQQQHSAQAVIAEKPWKDGKAPQADAIVTATPGLAIGVLTADCAPVLFYDARARVIGAAHAGWKGALAGIVEATLDAMLELGARRETIGAAIGPAISQRAYEVGQDFIQNFLGEDADAAPYFAIDESSGEPHFDLAGYVGERLARAGIGDVTDLGLCTYCDETRLFSYRRSQHHGESDYGRQISAILLA
jgi:YfiH family protein